MRGYCTKSDQTGTWLSLKADHSSLRYDRIEAHARERASALCGTRHTPRSHGCAAMSAHRMLSLPVHELCLLALLSALYLCAMISSDMCFTHHISHGTTIKVNQRRCMRLVNLHTDARYSRVRVGARGQTWRSMIGMPRFSSELWSGPEPQ